MVTGVGGRMPFVALLWDVEELEKPAGTVAVCISVAWEGSTGLYVSKLCRGWGVLGLFTLPEGHGMGLICLSPLQGDITATITKAESMQLCMNEVCTLPAESYSRPFHGK